jgi:MobA/MobL family
MPTYHVHLSYIKKGSHQGGAAGFARYLRRDGREEASQFRRYLEREGVHQGKDDLVAAGSANLPRWAQGSAAQFWQAADTFERTGWVVARPLQVALPRELSSEGRLELAHDLCEMTVGKFPHSWAVHEPEARNGSGLQPHLHILFSPRREEVELDRTPAQWFAKAAARGADPRTGGVRKDRSWDTKGRLYDVREAVALLTNAALARTGLAMAVDHRRLEARGLSRDAARYGSAHDQADLDQTLRYRQQLSDAGALAYEQLATYAGWQEQALKLLSLERQYVKDLVRDHVWRDDRSPARALERQQSLARTFALALGERPPTRAPTQGRTPPRPRPPVRQRLQELAAALERADEPQAGAALRGRLYDREHEQDRGRGW